MKTIDFGRVEVKPWLPATFLSSQGQPMPDELSGSEIIAIGTPPDNEAVEGGGLIIDYRRAGDGETRRVVFAFNELGMWVVYSGHPKSVATPV